MVWQVTNEFVAGSPNNVAPLIGWLCSLDGASVTGRIFNTNAYINGYQIAESFTVTPWEEKDSENWTHVSMRQHSICSLPQLGHCVTGHMCQ
jgi:hypothetical protein